MLRAHARALQERQCVRGESTWHRGSELRHPSVRQGERKEDARLTRRRHSSARQLQTPDKYASGVRQGEQQAAAAVQRKQRNPSSTKRKRVVSLTSEKKHIGCCFHRDLSACSQHPASRASSTPPLKQREYTGRISCGRPVNKGTCKLFHFFRRHHRQIVDHDHIFHRQVELLPNAARSRNVSCIVSSVLRHPPPSIRDSATISGAISPARHNPTLIDQAQHDVPYGITICVEHLSPLAHRNNMASHTLQSDRQSAHMRVRELALAALEPGKP